MDYCDFTLTNKVNGQKPYSFNLNDFFNQKFSFEENCNL